MTLIPGFVLDPTNDQLATDILDIMADRYEILVAVRMEIMLSDHCYCPSCEQCLPDRNGEREFITVHGVCRCCWLELP